MAWVKFLAHSRALGNGDWSNILTPSCLLSGHVSGGGMFPGPHKPPAEPVEPESSIHSIYKKQDHTASGLKVWWSLEGGEDLEGRMGAQSHTPGIE